MEKEFLDASELMTWLGISKPTLLVWLRNEDDPFPGIKVGGRWRFRRQAVLEWWQRREQIRDNGKTKKISPIKEEPARETPDSIAAARKASDTLEIKKPLPPKQENDELSSWLMAASKILSEEGAGSKKTKKLTDEE